MQLLFENCFATIGAILFGFFIIMIFMHLEAKNPKNYNPNTQNFFEQIPFIKKYFLTLSWLFLSIGNFVSFYVIEKGFFIYNITFSTSIILFFYIMGIFFVFGYFE